MDDKAVLKDHRQIGQELDLFSFHDVSPGAVYWHAKGWLVYRAITDFVRSLLATRGYQEISTPILAKADLFKRSGHWEHYHENMFVLDVDKETYAQKPMNCPEACLIYATKTRSYHDLPIRLADCKAGKRQKDATLKSVSQHPYLTHNIEMAQLFKVTVNWSKTMTNFLK